MCMEIRYSLTNSNLIISSFFSRSTCRKTRGMNLRALICCSDKKKWRTKSVQLNFFCLILSVGVVGLMAKAWLYNDRNHSFSLSIMALGWQCALSKLYGLLKSKRDFTKGDIITQRNFRNVILPVAMPRVHASPKTLLRIAGESIEEEEEEKITFDQSDVIAMCVWFLNSAKGNTFGPNETGAHGALFQLQS